MAEQRSSLVELGGTLTEPCADGQPAAPDLRSEADEKVRRGFAPGTAIGRYEVIRPLGEGAMGEVYLARDTRLGRKVALKFLLKVDARQSARFLAEARATAQLAHENIVALHDIADLDGLPYMVLEYVQGKTLSAWLRERADSGTHRAGLPPVRAAQLMLPVARALCCAHEAGIVHRDLKPSNLMLSDGGTVKVLDFGVAKLLGDVSRRAAEAEGHVLPVPTTAALSELTQSDALIGTQAYMAPEQWSGGEVDGRTDIWAVGIMLYRLVTGEHPLAPLSLESLVSVPVLDQPMPSVLSQLPEIGRLGAVIDRCLVKPMDDRLGSARELCAELEAIARPHVNRETTGQVPSPYAGLAALKEGDAAHFFGRDGEVEQVVARLVEQPLLAIVGSSGAGKSSLVRAGVIPALKRSGDAWEAFVLRPGPHPLAAVAELLIQRSWDRSMHSGVREASLTGKPPSTGDPALSSGEHPVASPADPEAMVERLRQEPGLLGARMRSRARRRRERILIFVDQFEEVVTLASEDERGAFLDCLAGAADDASAPLRVVVSVRQDFLDRVAGARREVAELMSRGTVLVRPMGRAELRSALVKPAAMLDHRFESEAMVNEMLDALSGVAGALPLLQFTAAKLWEGRDWQKRVLTESSYRAFGGVSGALASHADSVLAAMSHEERRGARALLLRLVTPERTRAVVTHRELSELGGVTGAPPGRVLGRLIEARLLTVEGAGRDESTVELVHESLIHTWPALSRWLEEEQGNAPFRARLYGAAREWEASGRAEGLLWRGEAAEEARHWLKRQEDGALRALEEQYLAAVVALAGRERRRRRQIVGAVIAGLCVVVVLVSALAVRSDRAAARAAKERAEAERSAALARNATRMAAARERQGDPTTVLALLREIEPGATPRGWAELTRWAMGAGVAPVVLLHDSSVEGVAWSPDGRHIVSTLQNKLVDVWNADGSGEPLVLRGHEDSVYAAAYSPDGRRIATASWDKTVRVWNADGAGPPAVLRGHRDRVYGAAFSSDGRRIVSASHDKTVRVWNADGSGEPLVLEGHEASVETAVFSPDGLHIVSASEDNTARVWNADGSGQPFVFRGHGGRVYAAGWSPDGRRIASASQDKTVQVWTADGSGEPLVLRGHGATIDAVAWSPDGQHIVSGAWDDTVRVWNEDGAGEPLVLRGHTDRVYGVTWSPDGRRVASGSWDKTVRVWNADSTMQPRVFQGHDDAVKAAAFSADGRRIVSASYDKTVRIWSTDGRGEPLVLRGHGDLVYAAAFSPDGRRVASASYDKTVRVWSADGKGEPLVLRGHGDAVRSVAWSPDGRRIATASWDRTVRVWNADGSGEPLVHRGHTALVFAAAWSPDGRRIASASDDRTVQVWNADGSGQPLVLRGCGALVYAVAWSPDGRRIASASWDKAVRIWNADSSGEPLVLRGDVDRVFSVAWSPDGRRVLAASGDGTVSVWSADRVSEPLVMRASSEVIDAASWSPDGKHIVTASDDKLVTVWSDLEAISGPDDPKLWSATNYCMPLEVRQRLLDFTDAQARADLERCRRRVEEARARSGR